MHYYRFRRTGRFTRDAPEPTGKCLQCAAPIERPNNAYCNERCYYRHRRRCSEESMACLLCGAERKARSDAIYCTRKCATKAANLRLNYGLSAQDYRHIIDRQGNACAVCHARFDITKIVVDHCHETGQVRGLLCSQCNVALGMLGEKPERIHALAQYAANHAAGGVAGL